MTSAIFPGSFDPATNGHLNIIERASKIFDKLVVLVVYNSSKKTIFTVEERIEQIKRATSHLENVDVVSWSGLTVEFAAKIKATVILRGLRNGTDFDYELCIAEANKKAAPEIETVFMTTAPEYLYLSSSVVKEFFSYGGDVSRMVHEYTLQQLYQKYELPNP